MMSLLDACADSNLFGQFFAKRKTFDAWFCFIAALFALDMTDEQLALYKHHTGRTSPPSVRRQGFWDN